MNNHERQKNDRDQRKDSESKHKGNPECDATNNQGRSRCDQHNADGGFEYRLLSSRRAYVFIIHEQSGGGRQNDAIKEASHNSKETIGDRYATISRK